MDTTMGQNSTHQNLSFDPHYLQDFEAKVFMEGAKVRQRLTNFFVLLLLSTVIATYGVLSDSTATVIGAMIVAPLMGPIMATTAAVVMGSFQRSLRSLALVIVGVVSVILFSVLLTLLVPTVSISFTNNGEITSRISPGLYALLTALGAGAAGAYITAKAEIADAMGGVAIAISLVPPLCVVGISISQGNWAAAAGSLLLFLTNLFAILLAGGIVFFWLGLGRLPLAEEQTRIRRRSFTVIAIGTLIIAIPLTLSAYRSVVDSIADNKATTIVQSWLEGTPNQVLGVNVDDRQVSVSVEGEGGLQPVGLLANKLTVALKHPVTVHLRVISTRHEIAEGGFNP
jgi:uncharacterized hydrophobic protein (TIGR00271 family)